MDADIKKSEETKTLVQAKYFPIDHSRASVKFILNLTKVEYDLLKEAKREKADNQGKMLI